MPTARAEPERWLADAMLGKLARYLRFLGADTVYVRELSDPEIIVRAAGESRTVITRDRGLAGAVPGTILLRTVAVREQLAEMFARVPGLARVPSFDRCPECNSVLTPWDGAPADGPAAGVAREVRSRGLAVAECPTCDRYFWDGSHADRIRQVVSDALAEAWPP